MEETKVAFSQQEMRKLEYLVRQRIKGVERRIEKKPEEDGPKYELAILDQIQDKLERARLKF